MKKVLVFQTWGIGDMIMSTPMLGALRQQLPEAAITMVAGSRAAADVIEGSHLCNEVRVMAPGRMHIKDLIKTLRGFKQDGFDAAILCTRLSPRIAQLVRLLSGIKMIAGDSMPPRRWGYTHWTAVDPRGHRVTANLSILRTVLPEAEPGPLYFRIDEESRRYADKGWSDTGLDGRAVMGIHPGSDPQEGKDKRIPIELCRSVILGFLNDFPDARVVLVLGPADTEVLPLVKGIDERVIVVHDLPLRVVGGLIAKMQVFLAGDTGLGHMAAALGVPVVTLAGPTEVVSTRPWNSESVIIRTEEPLTCMPCYGTKLYGQCPFQQRCMSSIKEEDVSKALSRHFPRRDAAVLA